MLKTGKSYKIDWEKHFTINELNYYIKQGFNFSLFCEKYNECVQQKTTSKKFEFLGTSYHPCGHFHVEYAKVKINNEELLIPKEMLI